MKQGLFESLNTSVELKSSWIWESVIDLHSSTVIERDQFPWKARDMNCKHIEIVWNEKY